MAVGYDRAAVLDDCDDPDLDPNDPERFCDPDWMYDNWSER